MPVVPAEMVPQAGGRVHAAAVTGVNAAVKIDGSAPFPRPREPAVTAHTPPAPGLTYRDAGVDIDAGNEVVERIKPLVRATLRPEVLGGVGLFGQRLRQAQRAMAAMLAHGLGVALGVVLTLIGFGIAILVAGYAPGTFLKAITGPMVVALSTRSSLASLPAMLQSAADLRIPQRDADVVLPLAVALFRATGPAMNIGVALYVAHWLGVEISWTAYIAGIAVADGRVILTGTSRESGLAAGAANNAHSGGTDVFVAALSTSEVKM